VDRRIRVPEVLVIDGAGNKLGIMDTRDALRRAEEQGLNLVEVSPNSRPPVCRILDYGRYKYEQKQQAKKKKKNQVVVEVKEVKFRPKIEKHDFETKLRHVESFLAEGNKVRTTIMFRGREITHKNLGQQILEDVIKDCKDVGQVEMAPRMEGRQMFMILAPSAKVAQRARDLARQQAEASKKDNEKSEKHEKSEKSAAPAPAGDSKPEGNPAATPTSASPTASGS